MFVYNTSIEKAHRFFESIDYDALERDQHQGHGQYQWTITMNEDGIEIAFQGHLDGTDVYKEIMDHFDKIFQLDKKLVM